MTLKSRIHTLSLLGTLVAALSACDSMTLDPATDPGQVGTIGGVGHVAVVLTDAPNTDFAEINVTIKQIELLGDDETLSYVVFQGEKTVDLLKLKNFSEVFGLAENVPAGTYRKIRLTLKQPNGIQLVRKNSNGDVIETAYASQPGNGKLDLNPRGAIVVNADATTYVQLDFDASKSIHIVQTGAGNYQFRPVIFVDVITKENPGKLVRQVGYVHAMDQATHTLRLCTFPTSMAMQKGKDKDQVKGHGHGHGHHSDNDDMQVPSSSNSNTNTGSRYDANEPCVRVDTTHATVYDNQGNPVTALSENESVMVVGYLTRTTKADDEAHYEHYRVVLDAEVIEKGAIGTYQVVTGKVKEAATTVAVPVTVVTSPTREVSAKLQVGTKVFSRQGERLDISAIKKDVIAAVDGVWIDQATHSLRTTLVILDIAKSIGETHVSGTIKSINLVHNQMQVATATGDITVLLLPNSDAFAINSGIGTTLSRRIELNQLVKDAHVDIYATPNTTGDFVVDTVIMLGA